MFTRARWKLRRARTSCCLGAIVAASFAFHTFAALIRQTPYYFPDEYMYGELGRSLALSGRFAVRGGSAHFPALLQPIVTAPAWLFGDVETGYRAVQMIGTLAMSLAAVPAYVLARRIGLTRNLGLAIAAIAVAVPDLVYAGWIMSEPLAYPLVLGAVAAGTVAVAQPTKRAQVAFAVLSLLAAFSRTQFVVLPGCFVVTVLVAGVRERRLRQAVREQLLPLGILALPVVLVLQATPERLLGFYAPVLRAHVDALPLLDATRANAVVLLYASGAALIPGALLGAGLALRRPRSRAELAYASFTISLTVALLLEAGTLGEPDKVQERYVFYLIPLAALAFGLYASRGWPSRLRHAVLACGVVAVASQTQISGLAAAGGKAHSPLLGAAATFEQGVGGTGVGWLALAMLIALLLAVVVAASPRPRLATVTAIVAAASAMAAASAGAVLADEREAALDRKAFFPRERSWVDRLALRNVALLRTPGSPRSDSIVLFWNRSVNRVLLLPSAFPIDTFRSDHVRIGRDGTMFVREHAVTGSLLVDEYAATVRFHNARVTAKAPAYALWRPIGRPRLARPRLALYLDGRYADGWLAPQGAATVWSRRPGGRLAGWLVLRLIPVPNAGRVVVHFRRSGVSERVELRARVPVRVRLRVCATATWRATFTSNARGILVGRRLVSAQATAPRFVASDAACRRRERRPASE